MNCQMKRNGRIPPSLVRRNTSRRYRYVPPVPGMAAASSLQTRPSHNASTAPNSQPSMHCGPPMEAMISGMVMNGPTPTMLDMLRAEACSRPKPRIKPVLSFSGAGCKLVFP